MNYEQLSRNARMLLLCATIVGPCVVAASAGAVQDDSHGKTLTSSRLSSFKITRGKHLSGGKRALSNSDGRYLTAQGERLVGGGQVIVEQFEFRSRLNRLNSMCLEFESRINEPAGSVTVYAKNWKTGKFVRVDRRSVGLALSRIHICLINGRRFVDDDGRIAIRLTYAVTIPSDRHRFRALTDRVSVSGG